MQTSLVPRLPDLFNSCNVERIGEPGDEIRCKHHVTVCTFECQWCSSGLPPVELDVACAVEGRHYWKQDSGHNQYDTYLTEHFFGGIHIVSHSYLLHPSQLSRMIEKEQCVHGVHVKVTVNYLSLVFLSSLAWPSVDQVGLSYSLLAMLVVVGDGWSNEKGEREKEREEGRERGREG